MIHQKSDTDTRHSGYTAQLTGRNDSPSLLLRHLPGCENGHGLPVLYVHGATFSSALSVGFRFAGRSWLDELSAAGFDAWSFDFAGYGGSARYAAMAEPAMPHAPLGRAEVAALQIEHVARTVSARHNGRPIALIAHSWGCIAAGLFATRCPDLVASLVFFGPITERQMNGLPQPESLGGWRLLTIKEQYDRFVEDVPADEAPVLELGDFDAWAAAYLASDPDAGERQPPAVKIPAGPAADILAAWQGRLAYDPRLIRAPLLILRGEWDSLCRRTDAAGLLDQLQAAPARLDMEIPRATHLMHLETGRFALYRAAADFLSDIGRTTA